MQNWDWGGKIVEQTQPNLDKLVRMGKKQKKEAKLDIYYLWRIYVEMCSLN